MEVKNKHRKRERLYAYVGKWDIAKRAYVKKHTKIFMECLEALKPLCHTSIHTLSILSWYQMAETGNPAFILKEPRQITKLEANCLNYIYSQLRNDLIKEFGWDDKKKMQIELMQEIIARNLSLQIDGDLTQYTWIRIAQEKLNELLDEDKEKTSSNISLVETAVALSTVLKIDIKVNECSVAMFYGYIKMAEKMSKTAV